MCSLHTTIQPNQDSGDNTGVEGWIHSKVYCHLKWHSMASGELKWTQGGQPPRPKTYQDAPITFAKSTAVPDGLKSLSPSVLMSISRSIVMSVCISISISDTVGWFVGLLDCLVCNGFVACLIWFCYGVAKVLCKF